MAFSVTSVLAKHREFAVLIFCRMANACRQTHNPPSAPATYSILYMTFGERVKTLRRELGLSQEAFGAQGFVSAPGWIKIENGQRQASEKLIEKISRWLVDDKYMRAGPANTLREELLTLKYLGSGSTFVRELAKAHAQTLPGSAALLVVDKSGKNKPRRGRPPGTLSRKS